MKIKVNRDALQTALSIVDSVISSKSINTILSNCRFIVSKDQAVIIATDNEIAIRTTIDVLSDSEGSFLVNSKKFSGILKELPNDEIELDVTDSFRIRIKSMSSEVKGHYDLVGMSAHDFPEMADFHDDESLKIDQAMLKSMLKKVMYAASYDTIKPVFNGIYAISEKKNSISLVATDSRRLSLITRQIDSKTEFSEGIILPLKTMSELVKLLDVRGFCNISVTQSQCFIKIGPTEIISRIVDGQFPNFRQVIPKEFIFTAFIETQRLVESLRRALVFTREPAHRIVLTFKKDKLILSAQTPELGEAEEELLIDCQGNADIAIGVNALFMIDALKEIESPTIRCGITGQMSPIMIQPSDDEMTTSVVMPIQIKN